MHEIARVPAYLALANALQTQIETNLFRVGDRLPSVRSLCNDHRLSLETVLHTLRVLEDRGLVEARPRSGFYIRFRNRLPEPSAQPLRLEESTVEVSKLRYQAFSLGNSKGVIPLGVAIPHLRSFQLETSEDDCRKSPIGSFRGRGIYRSRGPPKVAQTTRSSRRRLGLPHGSG